MIYLFIGFAVFGILTAYPFEFWRKTPYMFANLLSVYLFHNIMLCPNSENGYRSALAPYINSKDLNDDRFLAAIAYIYLFFSFVKYFINNILGFNIYCQQSLRQENRALLIINTENYILYCFHCANINSTYPSKTYDCFRQ